MQKKEIKIKPGFPTPQETSQGFKLHLQSLTLQITNFFAESIRKSETKEEFFVKFNSSLPFIHYSFNGENPCTVSIMVICHAQYTHGAGRFISDVCSRWLNPGRQLPIVTVNSLVFEFEGEEHNGYLVHEIMLLIDSENSVKQAKNNIEHVMREIRLNIMAVEHARTIVSLKTLTLDQKKTVIQENLSSLLDRPSKDFDLNVFDQMHHAIIKILGEKKVDQVRSQVASLYETRPQVFEQDVFDELQRFISLFKEAFTAVREIRHITRIVAYMYLFRKNIHSQIRFEPYKRHLSLKILKANVFSSKPHQVLGIVIAINLLRENEIFEEKHILEAIKSSLPELRISKSFSVMDRREFDKVRILYLEIAKDKLEPFSVREIKALRKNLPFELKSSIESMINPVFMPRNEEEVMRNILTLSKQLKYVHDIPQVFISFSKQTEKTVSFTVVMLRLIKPGIAPLKTLFSLHASSNIYFDNLETKIVGQLRKKYLKEANVFEIHLNKHEFLRKDYSLDLYEARKKVYSILTFMLGEVRDYNGGMISKQTENFKALKGLVKQHNLCDDFILKNFFYSINPVYMQSLLSPKALCEMFIMLNHALHFDYNTSSIFLEDNLHKDTYIIMLGAINTSFKDFIMKRLSQWPLNDRLITSSVTTYDVFSLGFLLKLENEQERYSLLNFIENQIQDWNEQFEHKQKQDRLPLHLGNIIGKL